MTKDLYDLVPAVDEAKTYTIEFTIWPKLWRKYLRGPQTRFRWRSYPFNSRSKGSVPETAGIYTFVVNPDIAQHCCSYLMYVGRTVNQTLRERFAEYLREKRNSNGRPQIVWLLNKYSDRNLFFCCTTCDKTDDIEKLEEDLIEAFVPPFNRRIPGKVGRIKRAF
jgi:hypothetical protein